MRTNRPDGAQVEAMFDDEMWNTLMAETREARRQEKMNEDRIHALEVQQADLIRQVKEKDAEIVRLRTAMVLAMADCETEAALAGYPITRKSLMAIAENLRAELKKQ